MKSKKHFGKGSKLYSIIRQKCPRCQEGNLFLVKNPYNLKRFIDMPDHCPDCNQDFKIEPGFYTGALWVSYPILVLLVIPLAFFLVDDPRISLGWIFAIIGIVVFGMQPMIMRLSRAIWINVFVKYDPEMVDRKK